MKTKIYILHGWAIDENNEKKWDEFRSSLSKESIETKFLPLPGLSTKLDKVWGVEDYVNWLNKQLPEKEKVILLGHSFGGQISSCFAAQYPEKVEKLILIDSAGIIDRSAKKVIKRFVFGLVAKIGKKFFKHYFFQRVLYKLAREKDYVQANKIQKEIMKKVINFEVLDYLPQIEAPTLIIWGKNDTATSLKLGHIFKQEIKNSSFKVVDGARHSPQFTHTQETVSIIVKFLK